MIARRAKLAAVVGATAGALLPMAPADAAPSNYGQNICGGVGCNWNGHLNVLKPLKNAINANGLPMHIGIQEACASQYNDFKTFLRNKDANMYGAQKNHQDVTTACGSNTAQWFGPATYVYSGDANPHNDPARVDVQPFAGDRQSTGEQRGWACLRGSIFGVPVWGCTAHMYPGNHDISGAQFADYYNRAIAPRASTTKIYWGGDFYLTPAELPQKVPGFSWTANSEADQCLPGEIGQYRWTIYETNNNGVLLNKRKVDYTFRSGPGGQACSTDATLTPTNESLMYRHGTTGNPETAQYFSDHRLIAGHQPA